jgi:hypothetical protein
MIISLCVIYMVSNLFQDIKGVFVFEINCDLWEYRQQEEDQLISCLRYIYGETVWSAKSRMLDLRSLIQVSCGGILHILDYNFWQSPKKLPLRRKHAEESMLDVSHL